MKMEVLRINSSLHLAASSLLLKFAARSSADKLQPNSKLKHCVQFSIDMQQHLLSVALLGKYLFGNSSFLLSVTEWVRHVRKVMK